MSYHGRIESGELASLSTIRSRNSELWLINNPQLEQAILGYIAKCQSRYGVKIYALAIEGNHLHSLNEYPQQNRASFQRDVNSAVARAIPLYAKTYPGGKFWARRYSSEFVPEPEDIEDYFFYLVLQPVKDGLVDRLSDFPGYNCFNDAVNGVGRKFKVIRWAAYNDKKRWNPEVNIEDFTEIVELRFERLPGYDNLTQKEYKELMLKKLEIRRQAILRLRNTPATGRKAILSKIPGSSPYRSKISTRYSLRPRILCANRARKAKYEAWYFDIYFAHKEACRLFRAGNLNAVFPPGTYRPPLFTCKAPPIRYEDLR